MKNLSYLLVFLCLFSCTSNTIFEKPEDLIPKDTMSLLLQELSIASSSKFMKNKNFEKKINYMPLVYDQFKIDSTRFKTSNLYYMSKIDKVFRHFYSATSCFTFPLRHIYNTRISGRYAALVLGPADIF